MKRGLTIGARDRTVKRVAVLLGEGTPGKGTLSSARRVSASREPHRVIARESDRLRARAPSSPAGSAPPARDD